MFKIKYVEKFWKWFWTITCVRIFKILKNKADWIRVRAFVAQVSDVASDPLVFMWLNTPFHTIVDNKIYHNITLSFKGLGINLSGGGGGDFWLCDFLHISFFYEIYSNGTLLPELYRFPVFVYHFLPNKNEFGGITLHVHILTSTM